MRLCVEEIQVTQSMCRDDKKLKIARFQALILYLFFCSIWCLLIMKERILVVFQDEWVFMGTAKTIAERGELSFFGTDILYKNIFYSLYSSVVFRLFNGAIAYRVLQVLNVLILGSGIFPYIKISELFFKEKAVPVVKIILLYQPLMVYSLLLMAESLFIPMTIWFIYFCAKLLYMNENKPASGVYLGILAFFMYLTKETALFYILGVCIAIGYLIYKEKIVQKWQVVFLLTFGLLFLAYIGMWTVCVSGGDGYTNAAVNNMLNLDSIKKLVFIFFTNVKMTLVAFIFLPLVVWKVWNTNSVKEQAFKVFIYASVCISCVIVSVLIGYNESEIGDYVRCTTRYIELLFPLFAVVLWSSDKCLEKKDRYEILLFGGLLCLFTSNRITGLTDSVFSIWYRMCATAADVCENEWIYVIPVILAVELLFFAIYKRYKSVVGWGIYCILLIFSLLYFVSFISNLNYYNVNIVKQAEYINQFNLQVTQSKENEILVVADNLVIAEDPENTCNFISYINPINGVYIADQQSLCLDENNFLDMKNVSYVLPGLHYGHEKYGKRLETIADMSNVKYIVDIAEQVLFDLPIEFVGDDFVIYRVEDEHVYMNCLKE